MVILKSRIILIGMILITGCVSNAQYVSVETRSNVEQGFLLLTPEKPVASVILFAGGRGNLDLSGTYIGWGKNNFLVRSRDEFLKHNFMVAVVDAPSDHKSESGLYGGFRDSLEHVEDIDEVITYLRKQADIPIWLIGTSRGTESVANIAIYSKESAEGIILTSSMSVENAKGTPVTDMVLSKITTPVMIVAHEDDGCWVTPPGGAEEIKDQLVNARIVELKYFKGGDAPQSRPCKALSQHGFYGIESQVVDAIARFITSQSNGLGSKLSHFVE